MTINPFSAARALCERRNWRLTNLELQKLLYLAHMLHLGRTGNPLVRGQFEAWDYGPVLPSVYHRAKVFGDRPVRNVFHWVPDIDRNSEEYASLIEAEEETRDFTPADLVAITHWHKGAWAQYYEPGERGIVIPNDTILAEYRERSV